MVPAVTDRLPSYPIVLAVISVGFVAAERLVPARKQSLLRRGIWSDVAFLVFNGHFLGVAIYWLAVHVLIPPLDHALASVRLDGIAHLRIASAWPLWLQIVTVIVTMDFVQWLVHRLLHRVPWLWTFHKIHHSVVDGQMDFLVSFRFHWFESAAYKAAQYLPLAFFGFSTSAVFVQAIFGTIMGHLTHSNLDVGRGPLRYVFNTPRMHLWHHDYDLPTGKTRNFGIVFSAWDWIFGTAYVPAEQPRKLGFAGEEQLPAQFVGRELWPIWRRR